MELWKYLLLVLISFSGSFLQRVTGFGYGIFMMMFLPGLVGSSVEAAALAGLISCCTCSYNAIRMRSRIQWKLAIPTVLASLITVPLKFRPSVPGGLAAGAVSGVLGGMFSMGGPPIVLYLVQALSDKTAYIATMQAHFAIINLYTAGTRALNGIITAKVLGWFAVAVIGSMVGNHIGGKLFDRMDSAKIKKMVYLVMILSGLTMIF